MTVSGQRVGAANVAASQPTKGRAASALDPLPDGWASFCSAPSGGYPATWYATAPYLISRVVKGANPKSEAVKGLAQTVAAPTWPELHAAVAEQLEWYRFLTGER